jgi:hypothetical protein
MGGIVIRFLVPVLAGAAVALAVAPSAGAVTCENKGVKHIGSGNSSIDVIACRAPAPGRNMREYGKAFIGSTSTRAHDCRLVFSSETLLYSGDVQQWGGTPRPCGHILRRNRTETFFGGTLSVAPLLEKAQRTVVRMYLHHGSGTAPPITAISKWVWLV